ncbi:hypothetical protein VPIG_00047 [Vibrio phage PWH3a-P1]|uniref:hypothetical protein n=1 Tax=Vibrio phage PWH3a-P1 TaxID=754058 RepID=UPI0002C06821|nr:hypothetical protein VPIG_00047 [Vibrio phage PWH3a-P1]AGH31905.1 hypothetical protein VPIG_00047 [Vibrio phage PWH3a-P1]
MIELKHLSNREVLALVRGCETPNFHTQNLKWQANIYRHLYKEFGIKYKTEIKLIVTGACKCVRYGMTGIVFPLDKKIYNSVNKNRQTSKISYNNVQELLHLMEEKNYLTILKGYFRSKEDSFTTCLRFHDKLLHNLNKKYCDKWGVSRLKDFNCLEVVDSSKSTDINKVMKNLQGFKGVKLIVDQIKMVNKEYEKHLITYEGETCCVIYKRRFEDDLQSGGRWYIVGTFQVESSDGRKSILIDSTPTVEIDIDRIHPSILASIAGFKLKEGYDPYDITDYIKTPLDHKVLRDFIKPCFMSLLYAKNRGTALYEIRQKLFNTPHIANWLDAETILESLEDHNHMLSDFFYKKENWKLCQYIDSQIATKLMVHFASKGEVCLNYHDSWVVTYHNKQELIEVMKDAWLKVVGNLDNFSYSIEFDNTPEETVHPAFEEIPIEFYEDNP